MAEHAPASAPIRVLLVDDHQILTEGLRRVLEDDPAITVIGIAASGAEGVESARRERPDVVVMDYHLPDVDGATATARLLGELPGLRVVALTGSDRPGARQAMRDAGCLAWVRKTRAAEQLVGTIRTVHTGREVLDEEASDLPSLDELTVHYQPVLELATERIVGLEALVRWNHPTRGLLAPGAFLDAAEETGFIHPLGRHVTALAIGQLARWNRPRRADDRLRMSVNASATSLGHPEHTASIETAMADAGVDPGDVVVEITETVLLEDSEHVWATLTALKGTGVRLALDDFGTAFSSLSYLRQFPFDEIKLDRTFIAGLPHDTRSALLVESILQLAASLGLVVVAEGIERREQAESLLELGCRLGQGYRYARPSAPAVVEGWLRRD